MTKTAKLYFYDTGLLCYLLGIKKADSLESAREFGAIFENLIISETAKRYYNAGEVPELYFYRDSSGIEVDLIDATDADTFNLIEIKSSQTYQSSFSRNLKSVANDISKPVKMSVVMRTDISSKESDVAVWSAEDWLGEYGEYQNPT